MSMPVPALSPASSQERPNILWISLEDWSPRMGCYGDPVARTPRLDALAAEGRRYDRAFATAPVCAPARCAIITGMYAVSIGAQHMRTTHTNEDAPRPLPRYECVPPPYLRLLPELLRSEGYYCTNNQKTDYQFRAPFTAWDENGPEAHWRKRPACAPFFAVFNLEQAHESGMWPEKRPVVETDPAAVSVPPYLPDTPKTRGAIARHYDNLAAVDRRVGEILDELVADGLARDTVVFVWSDHGEGLPRHKRWLHDTGLRVPLLVRWPERVAAGEVCRHLVSTVDLAPTVLSLAGIAIPPHLQGQAFLGPRAEPPRERVFATRDRYDEFYDCSRAVRDGRYKYIRNLSPGLPGFLWNDYQNRHPAMQELWRAFREGALPDAARPLFESRTPEELYDLEADPWELRNLADDPELRPELERLRRELDEWSARTGDRPEESEEEMVRRFWPGLKQPETEAPSWVVYSDDNDGVRPVLTGEARAGEPVCVQLYCPTQGASLGYCFENDPPGAWRLYRGPFVVPPGLHRLAAKAARIGYAESPARVLTLEVAPRGAGGGGRG